MRTLLVVSLALGVSPALASAQWLHQRTPGIPRTADGKADLAAPAPRTEDGHPDLSGLWQMRPGSYVVNIAQDLTVAEIQPWAESRFQQRVDEFAKNDPACFLPSGPRYYIAGVPKLIQTPNVLVILNDDLTYRQVFLDGRRLPTDPNPSFMGYSTGRWEGDTLVVESTGFDERTLLDTGGHPHSEHLRVTERFHRIDLGHMDLEVTFDDPAIYARPLVVSEKLQLMPDDELIEFVCRENEKDYTHITGRASDERRDVSPDILTKYVGAYEPRLPNGTPVTINVAFENGDLVLDRTPWIPGKMREVLIASSEISFIGYFGRRLHFVIDERGSVTGLRFETPEPQLQDVLAARRTSGPPEATALKPVR